MAEFFYRAKNTKNKIIQGYINADSITNASIALDEKGLILLEIKETSNNYDTKYYSNISTSTIFSISEKQEFFNSFFYLYKSGVPVNEIFTSIASSSNNANIKNFCRQILNKTQKGYSINDAVKNYKNALGTAYTTLLTAGEQAGKLEEIIPDIIKNLNREEKIKSDMLTALTYPAILLILSVTVFLFFKFFVLKIFENVTEDISYSVSSLFTGAVIKIILILGCIFGIILVIIKNKKLIQNIINIVLKISPLAGIVKNYYFTNFFSVLSLAYNAGVPLTEALYAANSVINISEINIKLKKSIIMLSQGSLLTSALSITRLFSDYAISQISAGEQAGELSKTLKNISYNYEKKFETSLKILMKFIEPLMLIIIGIFILNIAINLINNYYKSIFSLL